MKSGVLFILERTDCIPSPIFSLFLSVFWVHTNIGFLFSIDMRVALHPQKLITQGVVICNSVLCIRQCVIADLRKIVTHWEKNSMKLCLSCSNLMKYIWHTKLQVFFQYRGNKDQTRKNILWWYVKRVDKRFKVFAWRLEPTTVEFGEKWTTFFFFPLKWTTFRSIQKLLFQKDFVFFYFFQIDNITDF